MATIIDSLMISIGVDPAKAQEGFNNISQAAQKTDTEFSTLAGKWSSMLSGLFMSVVAPIAGAIGIGKMVTSYMNDVAEVATLTGAYNQKLEEWRLKRAQLARVTKEDIELYKKQREALTTFKIAMGDLSANLMRSFMPAMKLGVDMLNGFSKWINSNQDNIVRFLQVTAGVLTAIFLPAILKTSAAMLASPLTWVIGALGLLVIVIDDLVTYMQGGKSALSGFWSYFGTGPEIMAKLNNAFTVFNQVLSVIWKPLAAIAAGFAAFKIGSVLIAGFVKGLMAVKTALTALAAHPIMAIMVALIGLVMWIADAWKRAGGEWSGVLDLMKGDLKDFLNLFGGLGDTLAALFAPLEALFDNAIKTVANFFGVIFNTVKLIFAYLTGASTEAKDKIAQALWDCLGGLITGIATGVTELIKLIGSGISNLLSAIGEGLTAVPATLAAAMGAVWSAIAAVLDFIWSGITQLWTYITGLTDQAIAALSAPFIAMADAVAQGISSIWSGIQDFFSGLMQAASNAWAVTADAAAGAFEFVSTLWSGAGEFFDDICGSIQMRWMYLTGAVSDAFNDAADFITGAFRALGDAISGLISKAVQLVTNGLTTAWDMAVSAVEAAGTAVNSVSDTIRNVLGSAIESVTGLFQSVYDTVIGVFTAVSDAISNAFDSGLQAAQNFFDAVLGFFTKIPEMISKAFDIGGMIEGATNKLKEGLGGAWDKVTGFFGGGDSKDSDGASRAELIAQNSQLAMASTPVAAQTSNIVTNENNTRSNTSNNAKSNVNNITINTNSDRPQAIARALTGVLPEEDMDYGYVSAADNGNFNY